MDVSDLSVIERVKLMSEYRHALECVKLLRLWALLGLPIPDDVDNAPAASPRANVGSDHAALQSFLSQCTRARAGVFTQSSKLYERFTEFEPTKKLGWSQKRFSMAMQRAGFKRKQSSVVWWQGIEMLPRKEGKK